MNLEENEPFIRLIESRESDVEAQFDRERAKIRSKLVRIVRLPLGFEFGIFDFFRLDLSF